MATTIPPVVPWTVGFAGAALLYAAVRNVSPLAQFRAVLTGGPDAGRIYTPQEYVDSVSSPYSPTFGETPTNNSIYTVAPKVVDVRPGLQLVASAAAGFDAWQKAFGQTIPTTSGYRSYADQERAYKSDPDRFGDPRTSRHVAGDAVDVDGDWLARLSPAQQTKLRTTARATGWVQARYKKGESPCGRAASGKKSDNDEPWHFSFKVCG